MEINLAVLTCTLGNSAPRLDVLLGEMRRFTELPFEHYVSDDGTTERLLVQEQQEVCRRYGAHHLRNPGPLGLPENLNFAIENIHDHWILLAEDGLRPSRRWLEALTAFLTRNADTSSMGYQIGQVGMSSIEDWMAVLAGVIPTKYPPDVWSQQSLYAGDRLREFLGPWNTGEYASAEIHQGALKRARHLPQDQLPPLFTEWLAGQGFHPQRRAELGHCAISLAPGGIIAVRREAWQHCGRFREHCALYETHLACRMIRQGYVSLYLETPPFFHMPSLGFKAIGRNYRSVPRTVEAAGSVFLADFGVDHLHALEFTRQYLSDKTASILTDYWNKESGGV